MNRDVFQALARTRLKDAKALLDAERFDAAYYLAGYSVECALKACLCKQIREHHFPPRKTDNYYTHELVKLAKEAGVAEVLDVDSELGRNWSIVKDWSEATRYELDEDSAKIRAEGLISAIAHEGYWNASSNTGKGKHSSGNKPSSSIGERERSRRRSILGEASGFWFCMASRHRHGKRARSCGWI